MRAYKKYVTIKDPKSLTLSDLPFRPGQRVEVVVIAEDEEQEKRVQELRALLKKTQALPQSKTVSEDTIAEEIALYRAGR
jgi:predicted DNA-binding antitoxin AbrB/MazE fold protein